MIMTRGKIQPETKVIRKVLGFINNLHPKELQKANKEFQATQEAQSAKDDTTYYSGFLSYFLLQRKIKGATPMEYALLFPLDFFTKNDRKIIRNFVEYNDSLFQVVHINRKDYLIKNVIDSKKYLIKTIDFPNLLKVNDYISALIVKSQKGSYFFYGNVRAYSKENGEELKKYVLKNIKKIKPRHYPEIEWEIDKQE